MEAQGYWKDGEFWAITPCGPNYLCEDGPDGHRAPAVVECYTLEGNSTFLCVHCLKEKGVTDVVIETPRETYLKHCRYCQVCPVSGCGECGRCQECIDLRVLELATVTETSESERLSKRELDVLELVAKGLRNQEIAEALSISPHTVKTHMTNAMQKTGTTNRTQMARKVFG